LFEVEVEVEVQSGFLGSRSSNPCPEKTAENAGMQYRSLILLVLLVHLN
jgi:hypothetical protein